MTTSLTMRDEEGADRSASPARADTPRVDVRTLYDAHFAFIWRTLRRLGVQEANLDDACQQVFIIATKSPTGVRSDTARSYLFAIAVRVASDARRAARRRRETPDDVALGRALSGAPAADEVIEHREKRALLDEALDELTMEHRTVFVLYELEELSTPEIAELLGIPLGTAASRLRRAREAFQSYARAIAERAQKPVGGRR